jgi:predicted ATPase/DNA-binding winged helix-turn-helix (wHTH) protein
MLRFGRYQLDPTQGLRRGTQEVRVTPKSLSLLRFLVERAGQVVTKAEILRAVWPDTAVSDSALTSCIQELRNVLRDDARRPRFIETLHRRGYRFLAHPASDLNNEPPSAVALPTLRGDAPFVGREAVMQQLLKAWSLVQHAARQVLFVTGEPGVGKTTVVSAFLVRAAAQGPVRVAWAQCIQHFGVGEAYEPLLTAITRLCRQPGGDHLISILERYAPTWLAQLPALVSSERLRSLQRIAAGTTRERMFRELTDMLEAITASDPLILWLEDLHWCDTSTLEWVAAFAQRPEPARLLLIGTFRSSEIAGAKHPLLTLSDGLRLKGLCHEIPLDGLDESAVAEYMALRFPSLSVHGEIEGRLVPMVHKHTGGNPLFVVNVMSDLVERGLLIERDSKWSVRTRITEGDLGIPENIRRAIDGQIERLAPDERTLLEVASVVGVTFSASVTALVADIAEIEAESTLTELARRQRFVRRLSSLIRPDGRVVATFEFLHVLYRDAFHQCLSPRRVEGLHRQIGACEEREYGDRAPEIATELALHFERGRDNRRALMYVEQAAQNARRRSAYTEARMHFDKALRLLESLPPGLERTEREAVLRIGLGGVIMATDGWGAKDAEDAYSRAHALCRQLGESTRLFPALWGLWLFYWGRGSLNTAAEVAQDLLALADQSGDQILLLQSHHAAWATAFSRGELQAVMAYTQEGLRLYHAERDAATAVTFGNHDPGVCARIFRARALALLGRIEEAIRTSDDALVLARELAHPFSQALARVFAASVAQVLRDADAARAHAAAATTIAREQEFRLMLAWATAFEGWAEAEQGKHGEGLRRIIASISAARATGSDQFLPLLLGLLAEVQLKIGQTGEGLRTVDEALAIALRTGERFYEAELRRLKGQLQLSGSDELGGGAEQELLQALGIARSQEARLLVLRTAVTLGRLWLRHGKHSEARSLVAEASLAMGPELVAPDLVEVDAILSREWQTRSA